MADLNGDGIPDLIVANGLGNNIFVYLGLPSGQFASPQEFSVGADPVDITVSDLNGDGVPDLVVVNKQSNDLSIFFGQAHGDNWTLTSGPTLQVGTNPLLPRSRTSTAMASRISSWLTVRRTTSTFCAAKAGSLRRHQPRDLSNR